MQLEYYRHEIHVSNAITFKSYTVPINYQKAVSEEIERMLYLQIIEPRYSAYINPIVLIIKRNITAWLCLDARRVNEIIVTDYKCNMNILYYQRPEHVNGCLPLA